MPKYGWFLLSFFVVTGPGAFDAWISIYDRFVGNEEERVTISFGAWYESAFPILGLGILAFGLWWTRGKSKSQATVETSRPNNDVQRAHLETVSEEEANTPSPAANPGNSLAILEASPDYLVGIFRDRTTAEAESLVASYIGRQTIVKAEVFDVGKTWYDKNRYLVSVRDLKSSVMIFASFDDEWNDEIVKLQKKQQITVLGSIESIYSLGIRLGSCSLIIASND